MGTKLATFRYQIEIGDPKGDRFEAVSPWVDTGDLYSQFPASLLEGLGHRPNATRQFRLADGSIMERPIGDVPVRIGAELHTVVCVFADDGAEMLLGATTLEAFSLAPDPVNETLTPTIAMMLNLRRMPGLREARP